MWTQRPSARRWTCGSPGCRCCASRSATHSSTRPLASSTRPCSAALRMSVSIGRARRRRAQPGVEKFAIRPVADDQPVLGVVQREPLRDRLDRVAQALLAAPERDLRLLGCRDVAPRADHLDRFAVPVPDQVLLVDHPAVAAVLLEEPVLDRVPALLERWTDAASTLARSSECTQRHQNSGFSRYSSGS